MSYEQLEALMEEGWAMEHCPAQVAIYEEAVRLADSLNDTDASVETRMELVTAATFSGADEKALVAFAWVLAKFDEDPDSVAVHDLLWKYKWVISSITSFPTVSLEKIRAMEDDMERRYTACGFNLRPVYDVRADIALDTGYDERCREYFEKWRKTPRDLMADCRACEQNSEARYLHHFGQHHESLELAEPILSGDMSCSSVPETTYGRVLIPLIHLDRMDDARGYFELGYPLVSGNPDYIPTIARHLLFMVRDGQLDQAVTCVEQHLPAVSKLAMLDNRMDLYCTASALFEKLAAERDEVSLRLPEDLEIARADGKYRAAELTDWFYAQSAAMAAKFDARNGNSVVSQRNDEWRELAIGNRP